MRAQVKERDGAVADLEDQLAKLKGELDTRDEEIDRLIQLQNELDRKVALLVQENQDQGTKTKYQRSYEGKINKKFPEKF